MPVTGLDALATHLNTISGLIGVVWTGPLPDGAAIPDTCSAIRLYSGLDSQGQFGTPALYREWPAYQVLNRGPKDDQPAAYAQARKVIAALTAISVPTLIPQSTGVMYYSFLFRQPPYLFEQDGKGRYIFAFNMVAQMDPA